MAKWTAMYIETTELNRVNEEVKSLSQTNSFVVNEYPYQYLSGLASDMLPNALAVGKTQENWVSVIYNSFNHLEDWATQLSESFNCKVIVTIAQSVSSYYYFSLYAKGEKLREIEVCYGADLEPVDYGLYFDFENEQPGKEVEYDGEIDYLFDFDSIEEYCQEFGIEIQADYDNVKWVLLKKSEIPIENKKRTVNDKPWWKIW